MSNLNKILKLHASIDLPKEMQDWLSNNVITCTPKDIADSLFDEAMTALNDPVIRNEMLMSLLEAQASVEINKRKRQSVKNEKTGQFDYLAWQTSYVTVTRGVYMAVRYAASDVLRSADARRSKHAQECVENEEFMIRNTMPVIEYMEANGIATCEEAIQRMGLI